MSDSPRFCVAHSIDAGFDQNHFETGVGNAQRNDSVSSADVENGSVVHRREHLDGFNDACVAVPEPEGFILDGIAHPIAFIRIRYRGFLIGVPDTVFPQFKAGAYTTEIYHKSKQE